jgi:hypothetical protein
MNALSAVSSWLTSQNVFGDYDNVQINNDLKTEASSETNSFLSILKLLDTNADEKIGTDELKVGAGFMINSFLYGRDVNRDDLLSAEEAGVSPLVVVALDTDNDQMLSAGEIITPAGKIIDGLVSVMDLDGDKALSNQELAIIELLFSAIPSISTDQTSSSESPDQAFDLDTIPDRMRQAGFEGTDNQLYYALASTYAEQPWQPDPNDPTFVALSDQRDDIYSWFDNIVINVADQMEADPNLTAMAIIHDGPDRLGSRLGDAIMQKLAKYGDRIQRGDAYEEVG